MSETMQIVTLVVGAVISLIGCTAFFGGTTSGYETWRRANQAKIDAKSAHIEKMEAMKLEHERAIATMQLQPFNVETQARVPMAAEKGKS